MGIDNPRRPSKRTQVVPELVQPVPLDDLDLVELVLLDVGRQACQGPSPVTPLY